MIRYIYITENNDPQHAVLFELTESNELKVILMGDYYHDKISEKVDGFVTCLHLYGLEALIAEIVVDEIDSDFFYQLDFEVKGGFIYLDERQLGELSFKEVKIDN